MKLEVGKYYRTRDGRKVGPIIPRPYSDEYYEPFMWADSAGGIWAHNGENGNATGRLGEPDDGDLIAEWATHPSPVRTVTTTRQELVCGQYGIIDLHGVDKDMVQIRMVSPRLLKTWFTAGDVTAAISTLQTIRDAMQANTTA